MGWVVVRVRGGEAEGPREAGAVPAASLDSMRRSEKARVLYFLFLQEQIKDNIIRASGHNRISRG